jgi:hypothetical protein
LAIGPRGDRFGVAFDSIDEQVEMTICRGSTGLSALAGGSGRTVERKTVALNHFMMI